MSAKGYTTEEKIEDYLLQNIDPTFSTRIDEWMQAVEGFIDKYTGRNFKADSSATARLYDGDGEGTLLIDDAIAVTKVEVGNDSYGSSFSEVAATGAGRYFLDPANAAVLGLPFHKITLSAGVFSGGKQNQRITAKWGYSATPPADIIFAATVFMAGIINQQRGGAGDKVVREKIGNYDVTYSEDGEDSLADFRKAMSILDSFKKLRI